MGLCNEAKIRAAKEDMPIINRFEDLYLKRKKFEELINFSDIKKGDIYVNLIHYDKNMKNNENFEYYRYLMLK